LAVGWLMEGKREVRGGRRELKATWVEEAEAVVEELM
jgi:hypothetical protein